MYECKNCDKKFEKRKAYIGHCSSHNRGESYKVGRKKNNKTISVVKQCQYCNKIFEKGQALGGHISRCILNPNIDPNWKQKSINKIRKHSQETKDKISKARIKFLLENPLEVPYRKYHSQKESYPEKLLRLKFDECGITGWIQEYRHGLYSYDFAFEDLKLDVEIDGSLHNSEKVKKIDKRRDAWSEENGWKVIRFSASEIKKNIDNCVDKLTLHGVMVSVGDS